MDPTLDKFVRSLDVKATWSDLHLPPAELDLLRRVAEQAEAKATVRRAWGRTKHIKPVGGIHLLMTGERGAGKTTAAEALANELGLALHRVDLAAVVSKHIGETEKNLEALFAAAASGGSILFFDEADALFGKRTDVEDSHDRYANLELGSLLQRIEAYPGIAILATNRRVNVDDEFSRRFHFVVNIEPIAPRGLRHTP